MKNKCPKCNSGNIKLISYTGIKCVICNNCSFDESKQYEVFPEEKRSQKAKGEYNVYKAGGFGRAKKQ